MQNLQCVFRSPQNYNKIDIFILLYCCWSCPLASTLLTNTSCMISWDTGGVLLVLIWKFSLHICLNDLLHLQNIQTSLLRVQIKFFSVFRHLPVIFTRRLLRWALHCMLLIVMGNCGAHGMMTGFSRWQRSKQAILNCFIVRIFLIILQYFNFMILLFYKFFFKISKGLTSVIWFWLLSQFIPKNSVWKVSDSCRFKFICL